MDNSLTKLVFIIDRSGSMYDLQNDTISGYNSFIANQKTINKNTLLTTVIFDHEYIVLHNNVNILSVENITVKECFARGTTALYDAIGSTINKEGNYLNSLSEDCKPSKVVFVIITDGEENASKEFKESQVKEMIQHQTEKYNWEFIYLGANVDSFKNAQSLNIGTYSNYSATSKGVQSTYSVLSSAVNTRNTVTNDDLKGII